MHPTKDLQHVSWLLTLGMMKKLILLLAFLFVSVVSAAEYHGNRQSGIYHGPQCRYYFFKNCTVIFKSEKEARQAGYRRCKKEK